MRFVLDAEQRMFAESLDRMLAGSKTPGAVRAWADGDSGPGRALWASIAGAGVFAVAVPEEYGGAGVLPVELVTAVHELGRHAVPGPVVETIAAAALLSRLGDEEWLPRVAGGTAMITLAVPYALDADVADLVLAVSGDELAAAAPGERLTSLDPARRLFRVTPGAVRASGEAVREAAAAAYDLGALACAAQQLGVGRALLDASVEYAGSRHQFGRPIGGFQAVAHHLSSALMALEFARPLVYGAALAYGTAEFARDVSAAKVACAEAAYAVAKTALQVHGAIGYTDEYDPSLWIRKARALHSAWGSPSDHRARLMAAL
ncbi:acyl-CoA dehydrogenase family protein [Bailinhaonella thermotolerans]|uniref:Acyl-CoA dehydrogenase n=1 Tax=Bailinhaonella thermotolerans TaxID=1070861 RepID=A0A3A4A560_9ACTN|nr:acyl-CoA dehydrogenase family protein [Bailinhaonella thermotolerans]RJL20699.1 acyl-CoA dehydrogenase [Bailinhaonella thermotolerans]